MKLTALLEIAQNEGVVSSEDISSITGHLQRDDADDAMPWYLHALLAVGAWFAAAFFIGFFGALIGDKLWRNGGQAASIGALVIAIAVGVRRLNAGAFLNQLCLAFSVAGHSLLFFGIAEITKGRHDLAPVTLAAFALAAVLYFVYNDGLHRFLSTGTALAFSTIWLATEMRHHPAARLFVHASVLAHAIGIGIIFLRTSSPRKFLPLGYALAISLVAVVLTFEVRWFNSISIRVNAPLSTAILAIALIALTIWVAGGFPAFQKTPAAFIVVGCGIAGLGAVTNPAILVALGFLLIGFALQDRAFLILGAILLPVFTCLYYYNLQMDLMRKSEVLAASGALLLVLRVVVARMFWKSEAAR